MKKRIYIEIELDTEKSKYFLKDKIMQKLFWYYDKIQIKIEEI